jgi:hypothetical protein
MRCQKPCGLKFQNVWRIQIGRERVLQPSFQETQFQRKGTRATVLVKNLARKEKALARVLHNAKTVLRVQKAYQKI